MSTTTLSAADRELSVQQQAEILRLKQAWTDAYNAGDTEGMNKAHEAAENIRASAGYSGGADGSAKIATSVGGASAQEVQEWVDQYYNTHYNSGKGWVNGYSTAMNQRSIANYIRQQMQANSEAWNGADTQTQSYLHDQNLQLAKILSNAVGGAESTYNEQLGRWETTNANLGYGYNTGAYNDLQWYRDYYGMTDEQVEQYRNDTDRYRNFVDQRIIRNWVDESNGYTGIYSQFVNGPYGQLLSGTEGVRDDVYMDVIGDGFAEQSYDDQRAAFQENGPQLPLLKNNNNLTDYTRQFTAYVDENGIIQPGMLLQASPGGGKDGSDLHSGKGSVTYRQGENGGGSLSGGLLEQWQSAASRQIINSHDYAVDQAVAQLLRTQQQAEAAYQTRRDQVDREERNALDNSALYAELRGDRGGIGRAQYDQVQAQAAANRQTVQTEQTRLATETQQQIAQLRAEGAFEKADSLLELAQTYLLKLLSLEQWAAEYQLDTQKFQASVSQWEQEYLLKVAQLLK